MIFSGPSDFKGLVLSISPSVWVVFWPFLKNHYKDLPNLLHNCRGQEDTLFEPGSCSKMTLESGY